MSEENTVQLHNSLQYLASSGRQVPKPICILETVKVTTVFRENKTTNNSYRAIVESSYFAHAEKLLNVQHLNYAHTKH